MTRVGVKARNYPSRTQSRAASGTVVRNNRLLDRLAETITCIQLSAQACLQIVAHVVCRSKVIQFHKVHKRWYYGLGDIMYYLTNLSRIFIAMVLKIRKYL